MKVVDIKGSLRDARIRDIVSQSVYQPADEKLNRLMGRWEADADVFAYAAIENGLARCVLILERKSGGAFEILNVATDQSQRGQGFASHLISFAQGVLHCETIVAETDDDAVGFYRKYGFNIESLGEKYPGTVRYLCTRTHT